VADEDLASQGADDEAQADDAALQDDQQQQPDPYADLASEMGWKPKEQWQGPEDAWKPAKDFILAGRDINQSLSRELKGVREQIDRLTHTSSQIMQDKVAERDAYWQQQMTQAVEDGDTAKALELAQRRPQAQPQNGGADPAVARWIADNSWYDTHPRAKALAAEVSDRLARQGFDTATQLSEARAEVQQRYPELFGTPAKQPPATQTGASRNPAPSNRVKGFADMPQDSQRMAREYEKQFGVKPEDFAKSYWADQASQRSVRA
jgi:hypothetical protein